jgi:hypothetical protein
MHIAESVETISKYCFAGLGTLATITFECRSKVSSLGKSTLEKRSSLRLIIVRSSSEKTKPAIDLALSAIDIALSPKPAADFGRNSCLLYL